jgi:hypothetical protein
MRCLIASIIVTCEVGVFTFAVVVSVFCSTTGCVVCSLAGSFTSLTVGSSVVTAESEALLCSQVRASHEAKTESHQVSEKLITEPVDSRTNPELSFSSLISFTTTVSSHLTPLKNVEISSLRASIFELPANTIPIIQRSIARKNKRK